jgi:hypothetical protein
MASRPPEPPAPGDDDEARNRWLVISLLRFVGFGLAVLGLLMSQGAVDIAGDVNRVLGYLFVVVGLVDGFVVPQFLARKWRSPRE